MAETLYIRLGSQASDKITWLVYSKSEQEIIASGVLADASQLIQLSEKASQRIVHIFVPSCDVTLKQLKVPTKSTRAMHSAVPYMLEDELGQDVDELFFAYANLPENEQGYNCFVAIVAHQQIQRWQSWLASADIQTAKMQIDVLAMPRHDGKWSAIVDDATEQVLIRQGKWQGCCLDFSSWQFASQHLFNSELENENKQSPTVVAYSNLPESEQLTIEREHEELPLALLAEHSQNQTFNLLQGQYKLKSLRSKTLPHWLWAAGFAACALLLNVGYKAAQLWQLNDQQAKVEEQIIKQYKKTFPQVKKVRVGTIKSQLNRKIAELGGANDSEGFLAMLAKVQPAFAKVPELKPESLKFDGKRQELRLQAVATSYQHFERFKNALNTANLKVKQGAQNNQGDQITGSYSISNASSGASGKSTKGRS